MGLYGCFQFMGDPTLKTSNYLGDGMEFGLAYGTTGDYYYDVVGSLNPGYFTFTNFSFNYGPFFAFFIYPFAWLCI
jgi:YidC/Oxa1 family membrane protein insertase